MWYVYILKCFDKTFYTGITKDLERRAGEHNFSDIGAKYTRGRRPVRLVYSQKFKNRAKASQEECRIKKLTRNDKFGLIKKKS
jgi:putative endonuclease